MPFLIISLHSIWLECLALIGNLQGCFEDALGVYYLSHKYYSVFNLRKWWEKRAWIKDRPNNWIFYLIIYFSSFFIFIFILFFGLNKDFIAQAE